MSIVSKGAETSIKRAALINMASRYLSGFISMLYSILLARILSPADFGIVAIAQVFVTFLQLFCDMGFGSAVVQRQDLTPENVSGLFGFSAVLGSILGIIMALLAFPMSIVYREPALVGIFIGLAPSIFFATINTVPNALLMKSKRFMLVGVRQIVSVILCSILGLVTALLGAGPYAIIIFSIANNFVLFLWNYLTYPIKPSISGSRDAVGSVWGYSAYLFGFNFINYFSRNADNLLIGYYFGKTALGNYAKAYQLMLYPQNNLTGTITAVVHPMLAEHQNDIERIYGVYIRMTKALSLLGVFFSVICCFCADEIVLLLYGDGWGQAATCLKFLSVSIWSQMVCGSSGAMFQVLNRTKEHFIRGVLIAVVLVGSIMVGVAAGSVESVAFAVGIAYNVPFILMLPFLIKRSFGKSQLAFLRTLLPDFLIAIGLCAVLSAVSLIPFEHWLTAFAVKLLVGTAAYFVFLVVLGQAHWIIDFLPAKMKQKLSRK